jgi:hypothetical protein
MSELEGRGADTSIARMMRVLQFGDSLLPSSGATCSST